MNRTGLLWSLTLSMVLPALALGQSTGGMKPPVTTTQQAQMYEDIEIMGRLLNRAIHNVYTRSTRVLELSSILLGSDTGLCTKCHDPNPQVLADGIDKDSDTTFLR